MLWSVKFPEQVNLLQLIANWPKGIGLIEQYAKGIMKELITAVIKH